MRRSVATLVGAAACWGVGSELTKRALAEFDPISLLVIELVISCTTLTGVLRASASWGESRRFLRLARGELVATMGLGVLNPGMSYALGLLGLVTVSASVSVLLWATEPLVILGLAWTFGRHSLDRAGLWWALAALAGVVVVAAPHRGADARGVALIMAGVGACGLYSVLSERLAVDSAAIVVVCWQQIAALGFALLLAANRWLVRGVPRLAGISLAGWSSALAAGALYYALAFWLYLRGIRKVGAMRAGMAINLVPVFGLAASATVLHDRLRAAQWLGAAIVVGALVAFAFSSSGAQTSSTTVDSIEPE